jgi:hypothetical protein
MPARSFSLLISLLVLLLLLRHLGFLDVPLHEDADAVINGRDMVMHAGGLSLHCAVEILWLELSCSTSSVDLSHCGSWFNPHIWSSCVLHRLIVDNLALLQLSQNVLSRQKKSPVLTTIENRS